MAKYRIRMVRVVRVVEDGFVTVEGDSLEDAMACADEMEADQADIVWRRQDAETQEMQPDYLSLRPLANA